MKQLIFILFLFCYATAFGTKYYIAPTGDDDTGNGTSGNPWKTLAYACTQVTTAGDTIYVNAGTYTETERSNVSVGVNITGAGNTSEIICAYEGLQYTGNINLNSSEGNPVNGNQSISYIKLNGDTAYSKTAITVRYRNNVTIHHVTIADFKFGGILILSNESYYTPPSVDQMTGNSIYNCTFSNVDTCVNYAVRFTGNDGFLCYNNTFNLDKPNRITGNTAYGMAFSGYWNAGYKIYSNTINKADDGGDNNAWNFNTEMFFTTGGAEIYSNTFTGASVLDVVNVVKGSYDYGLKIYNNTFTVTSQITKGYRDIQAIDIEDRGAVEDLYIYNNYITNFPNGIWLLATPDATDTIVSFNNIKIYYNVFSNLGYTDDLYTYSVLLSTTEDPSGYTVNIDSVSILNNTISSSGSDIVFDGVRILTGGAITNLNIKNNIFSNCYNRPVYFNEAYAGSTVNGFNIQNNIFYSNDADAVFINAAVDTSQSVISDNGTNDPLFITGTYRLKSNSPAVNAGLDVGLTTDYRGYGIKGLPDIGAYEFLPISVKSNGKYIRDSNKRVIQY